MPIPALLPVLPPLPSSLAERPNISITGSDGVFWDLADYDGHVFLQPGFTGFDAPPVTVYSDGTPGIAGAAYLGSHDEARPVFLPVYTVGSTRAEAVSYRRALIASLSRGLNRLCVAETDGYRRYLDCYYTGGAEGAEGVDNAGLLWAIYGLNFVALDNPYWYGDVVTPSSWVIPNARSFFPLAPAVFTLSSSQVLGGTLIDNVGEVDAYPVWTLTGPASSLTLQLGTRTFTTNSTLLAGASLVIDTDPRTQTLLDNTNVNRWGDVDTTAIDLWPLPPGVNAVTVTVTGGSGATALSMSYVPRFLMR